MAPHPLRLRTRPRTRPRTQTKIAPALALIVALLGTLIPIVGAAAQANPAVVLNEILASNSSVLTDEDGSYSDWIELHNPTDAAVDLSGWHLTDDVADPALWTLPRGTALPADGYLVVFASGKDRAVAGSELHTNFRLSSGGEYLALTGPGGDVADVFDPYPPQSSNISWGVAGGAMAFFDEASPGAPNNGDIQLGQVVFGTPHGLMDQPFDLTLSSLDPNVTIRYTLDGSDPASGAVYSGPLNIGETTVVRARAERDGATTSPVTTQTYLFLDDVITQDTPPSGFPTSSVNGQVFDWGMDPDVVDPDPSAMRESLRAIPSLSLVTDTDHLFDPATGIYVNAGEDGIEWERPGSIELIDPTGAAPGFDVNAGIRIRGGYSRRDNNAKHSFRLFFRSEYGDSKLHHSLFGDAGVDSFDRIDLRSAQNYSWSGAGGDNHQNTMLRERWSRETQAAMGQPHTRSDHYHLYINGEYFGVYQTQERVSKDFTSDYLGGDKDDWDIVKHERENDFRFTATDGTEDAWRSLWPLVQDQAISPAEFTTISEQVDLANLADYYLVHFYSGDFDGAPSWYLAVDGKRYARANNWYAVRNRVDGKWEFFDHDSEHSLCVRQGGPSAGTSIDNTNWVTGDANPRWSADYMTPDKLHHALLANLDYRQIFADRAQLHVLDEGGALTTDAAIARLDALAATVGPAVLANSARWGDTNVTEPRGLADWTAEIAWIRDTCFAARRAELESQLSDDDLFPTVDPPTIPTDAIPWGEDLTISGGGTVWYTTDGSDPRGLGGSPVAGAIEGSTVTITDYTTITARVRNGDDWSAPRTADIALATLPAEPVVILNEYNGVGSGEFLSNDGTDETFGQIRGNGGDWLELVVVADNADLRGWQLELQDARGGQLATRDLFVLGDDAALANLEIGTIVTVSEDHPDDLSFDPAAGDWTINLQANSELDGALIAQGQQNFDTNDDDFALIIRDSAGAVRALRTGEGATALSGVSDTEVGKLEANPDVSITPASAYDDGTTSTWGLPNRWDDQVQDIGLIRNWVATGDVNASLHVDGDDVQALLELLAGTPDADDDLNLEAADVNDDGDVTLLDALMLARAIAEE